MKKIILTLFGTILCVSCAKKPKSIVQTMEDKYIEICMSKGISIVDSLEKHEAHLVSAGLLKDNSAASVYGIWEEMVAKDDGGIVAKYFVDPNLKRALLDKDVVQEYVDWILEGDFDKDAFSKSEMNIIEEKVETMKTSRSISAAMAGQIFTDVLDSEDFQSNYYRMVTYGILPFGRTNAAKK